MIINPCLEPQELCHSCNNMYYTSWFNRGRGKCSLCWYKMLSEEEKKSLRDELNPHLKGSDYI